MSGSPMSGGSGGGSDSDNHDRHHDSMSGGAMNGASGGSGDGSDTEHHDHHNYMGGGSISGSSGGGSENSHHDHHDHTGGDSLMDTHDRNWDRRGPPGNWHGYDNNRRSSNVHVNIDMFRRNITSRHHFRIGFYNPPRGYYHRRWRHGQFLPRAWFTRDTPPPGYVWVRVGDEMLLVDEYSGEIVEVVYDFFY